MIMRSLSSMTAGIVVTAGLLLLMQVLIATGEKVITEPRIRQIVGWVRMPEPEDPLIVEPPPAKPDKPPMPPKTIFPESTESGSFGAGVFVPPALPPRGRPVLDGVNISDGPLINVIKVQPQYPPAAARRGLEGRVIVQFDVTETGAVENPFVVETTNNVFNKAAIEAAYRFKYKPRVVDGKPYGAKGLRQQFRFTMDD